MNRSGPANRDVWVVLFAMGFPSLLTWAYFDLLSEAPALIQQGVYGLGKTVQFGFPLLVLLLVERSRLSFRRPRATGLISGTLFGAAVSALIVAAAVTAPWPLLSLHTLESAVRVKTQDLGIASPFLFAVVGVFYTLVHSLLEEYYFRWFLFARLRRLLPLPAAIVLSTLGFTAHHTVVFSVYFGWCDPMTWMLSSGVAIGGAVWAWLYHRTDSILAVWVSHALVDAGIFIAGYQIIS